MNEITVLPDFCAFGSTHGVRPSTVISLIVLLNQLIKRIIILILFE